MRLLIERVERIEEEIKGSQDDRKDVYAEAKSRGFCTKTMKQIVALRRLTPDQRREREAMLDLYRAALGMLDGTPLGNWAIDRLNKRDDKPDTSPHGSDEETTAAGPVEPETPAEPEKTVDEARHMGGEAARAGVAVTSNPFPPRDPRRAAWDEAWCQELGTDGMDIPSALKPAAKPKKDSAASDAAAEAAEREP